jgi:proteasome lid subunit RPN8/RPN11
MEVMGLMLGEFVDDYTVRVVDVFAMPQSGTGVSVEAVDHVFQTNMLDMLKQTGRCGRPSGSWICWSSCFSTSLASDFVPLICS